MKKFYTQEGNLGSAQELYGTREDWKKDLENCWGEWYNDYCNKCEQEYNEIDLTKDEYIEKCLDESLIEIDDDELENYIHISK